MEQLTWLQQSLQKPRLSAVARVLAEVFPRQDVPPVVIGESNAIRGTYNSASKLAADHLEYPGHSGTASSMPAETTSVTAGRGRTLTTSASWAVRSRSPMMDSSLG